MLRSVKEITANKSSGLRVNKPLLNPPAAFRAVSTDGPGLSGQRIPATSLSYTKHYSLRGHRVRGGT